MIPQRSFWRISPKISLVMNICDSIMIFQLLNKPRTGQYVQSVKSWYHICCCSVKPVIQGLYNIDVHSSQVQGIRSISHVPCPSFVSNIIWYCLLNPRTPCGFVCGTQNWNDGNWFVSQNVLSFLCVTSLSSWTWYSLYTHLFTCPLILFALINH